MKKLLVQICNLKKRIYEENITMQGNIDLKEKYKNLLHNVLPTYISENFDVYNCKITGSIGQGQYAQVPWVAILNENITSSTQKGYYIAYLFEPEGNGVFLSLNQGWNEIKKKSKVLIDLKPEDLARTLSNRLTNFIETNYSKGSFRYPLNESNKRDIQDNAKGYALGSICYKYYDFSKNVTNDELIADLKNFINIYKTLQSKVSIDFYEEMLVTLEDYTIKEEYEKINEQEPIQIVEPPKKRKDKKNSISTNKISDNELKKAQKQNELTGNKGEELAINYFKMLIKNHVTNAELKNTFLKSIVHISKQGHGDGFDISAFNPYNLNKVEKMRFEIKATTAKEKTAPFYISLNELFALKKYPKEIMIMRLYDIQSHPKAFFIDPYSKVNSYSNIEELVNNLFYAEPISYKILGLQ
ncbi:MrcB family domain-containing protein [Tetragenococcus halophilus]|uniref:Uncharacterized protein n=3 Tax=Tetragenococcus halophilus TaxID=51669 RepID=A0A2H6CWG5_TETHA|nr:DUF3578 domain-containing protein [Tetragenococcus halophilus]MCF1602849.1 DUF3578 domain-containing protein [Tetragenococcus halophilus]MCF1676866.1 DUF3578 domain-containing protein [Tetragenococcus halophilus]MCO8299249.1 DUF3578 domain-containing protein [Tetragenococcus halophilus]MDN6257992.1 DUF3578 domain-containing protein [Tetragenococcus halophilus]GBD60318.1 hypothetical protein TEH11_0001 [Tetragenococcus halophilus subsp. halophilus]